MSAYQVEQIGGHLIARDAAHHDYLRLGMEANAEISILIAQTKPDNLWKQQLLRIITEQICGESFNLKLKLQLPI